MFIRAYQPDDCRELAELFYHTVHTVNAGDYTEEQLDAWKGLCKHKNSSFYVDRLCR